MEQMLLSMLVFALVGAITPGPVNLIAMSCASTGSRLQGMFHVVGASVAYAVVVLSCGTLLSRVALLDSTIEFVLQVVGSGFLLYVAYRIATSTPSTIQAQEMPLTSNLWIGAIAQFSNPKAWLVAMSGVSVYVLGHDNSMLLLFMFTLISFLACLFGVGCWAWLGKWLSKRLEKVAYQRHFNQVMAILLAISVSTIWM